MQLHSNMMFHHLVMAGVGIQHSTILPVTSCAQRVVQNVGIVIPHNDRIEHSAIDKIYEKNPTPNLPIHMYMHVTIPKYKLVEVTLLLC